MGKAGASPRIAREERLLGKLPYQDFVCRLECPVYPAYRERVAIGRQTLNARQAMLAQMHEERPPVEGWRAGQESVLSPYLAVVTKPGMCYRKRSTPHLSPVQARPAGLSEGAVSGSWWLDFRWESGPSCGIFIFNSQELKTQGGLT